MGKAKPGVMIYFDIRQGIECLTMEQRGELLTAILDYSEHGLEPQLSGSGAIAWSFIKPKIDRDTEKYHDVCEHRRQNAVIRWSND